MTTKIGKPIVEILNSGGLRIPADIPDWLEAIYPPIFWNSLGMENATEDEVLLNWQKAFDVLKTELGYVGEPGVIRDNWQRHTRNAINSIKGKRPAQNRDWVQAFADPMLALQTICSPAQRERIERGWNMIHMHHNLIDFELWMKKPYEPSTASAIETQPQETQQVQYLMAQNAQLQRKIEQQAAIQLAITQQQQAPQYFRGRGYRGFNNHATYTPPFRGGQYTQNYSYVQRGRGQQGGRGYQGGYPPNQATRGRGSSGQTRRGRGGDWWKNGE